MRAAAFDRQNQPGGFDQARAENRVIAIGAGLGARSNGEMLRGRAVTQALDLRKYEPHPMTLLAARAQLRQHMRPDRRLRVDKALEIERDAAQRPAFSADSMAMEAQSFSLQPFLIASS